MMLYSVDGRVTFLPFIPSCSERMAMLTLTYQSHSSPSQIALQYVLLVLKFILLIPHSCSPSLCRRVHPCVQLYAAALNCLHVQIMPQNVAQSVICYMSDREKRDVFLFAETERQRGTDLFLTTILRDSSSNVSWHN